MSCSSEITVALPAPSRPRRPAGEWRRSVVAADDRPWERPGAVRRDCAPHRAGLLLAVADTSLLLGALSLPLGFCALMGLGLGVAGWALASRDLKRMRARVMNAAGRSRAARARARARLGVALSLYAVVLWGWLLLLLT
jgi:hypothetical protein